MAWVREGSMMPSTPEPGATFVIDKMPSLSWEPHKPGQRIETRLQGRIETMPVLPSISTGGFR